MAVNIKKGKTQPQAIVTKTTKNEAGSQETVNQIRVGEPVEDTPEMCNVGFSLAVTKNLGNYENVKASVSLYMPCKEEDIDSTFTKVKSWVDDKVEEVVEEVENL